MRTLSEPSPIFPLSRCEAMGEGARRAGEGSLSQQGILVEIRAHCTKEPSSGLRPPSPTLRAGEGKWWDSSGVTVEWTADQLERGRLLFAGPASFVMGVAKIEQLPEV